MSGLVRASHDATHAHDVRSEISVPDRHGEAKSISKTILKTDPVSDAVCYCPDFQQLLPGTVLIGPNE